MLLFGKQLNTNKALSHALKDVFGINTFNATKLCASIGLGPSVKLSQLNVIHYDKLAKICYEQVDTSLARHTVEHIKLLIQIKHYKGLRHSAGLPCRGQRTRTNASSSKTAGPFRNFKKRKK